MLYEQMEQVNMATQKTVQGLLKSNHCDYAQSRIVFIQLSTSQKILKRCVIKGCK